MIAFIAEYRVTSLHNSTPFQSVEDAKSAIRYIRSNAKSLSLDPEKIAVSGGSAGAHLAAASANISNYDNVNENLKISSKPNLLILFNPILDTTPGAWGYGSFMRRVGNKITDNPYEISPIHHISKKTPPTIILSGTNDNLVPVIKINQYKEIMISNNVRCDVIFYKDAEHSFFNKGEDFVDTVYQLDLFLKSNGYLSGDPTIKN
jgi:acetyl esterase/lipase